MLANPWTRGLALLALLQVGLVAATWWPADGPKEPVSLLADVTEPGDVDRLVLSGRATLDRDPPEVFELVRRKDGWVATSHYDVPVKDGALDELLDHLSDAEVRYPVVTRSVQHESLSVAEDRHERRVHVGPDDGGATLLYGAAQGTAAHVRRAGEDEVYRVRGLRATSIPDSASRLFELQVVDVDLASLATVELLEDGRTLARFTKTEDTWSLAAPVDERVVDDAALEAVLRKLLRVRMVEPMAGAPTRDHRLGAFTVRWTVDADGSTEVGSYRVGAPREGETGQRAFQVEGAPWVAAVRESSLKALTDFDLDAVLVEAEPSGE